MVSCLLCLPGNITCLSKSQNKHNRIFGKAEPLSEELCADIDAGKVSHKDDPKTRANRVTPH